MKIKFFLLALFFSISYYSDAEESSMQIDAKDFANQRIKLACTLFSDTIDLDGRGHGRFDTDKTKWKDYIEKNLGEELMHLSGDNENFKSLYRIEGIPRYILIDAEGNIVNAFIGNIKEDIVNELKRVSFVGEQQLLNE